MPRVAIRPAVHDDVKWMIEKCATFCWERKEPYPGDEHTSIHIHASIVQGLAFVAEPTKAFLFAEKFSDVCDPTKPISRVVVFYIPPEFRRNTDSYSRLLGAFVEGSLDIGYIPEFVLDAKTNVCENTLEKIGLKKKYIVYSE
jgi:hypothetical protein